MAITILGGQVLCLLLTLLVTPVVYSYFDDLREWSPIASLRRLWQQKTGRRPKAAEI
jgi:HAE1 family hydrophobic/amphiphilic exporter-1